MEYKLYQASCYACDKVKASTYHDIVRAGFKVEYSKEETSESESILDLTSGEYVFGVTITIDSLDELNRFIDLFGDIVIEKDIEDADAKDICIYDGYIE